MKYLIASASHILIHPAIVLEKWDVMTLFIPSGKLHCSLLKRLGRSSLLSKSPCYNCAYRCRKHGVFVMSKFVVEVSKVEKPGPIWEQQLRAMAYCRCQYRSQETEKMFEKL